ncbi:YkyA family protein [Metabacillus sp. RGM 3146]|uniref:YkyA family protein n=1 Tax=Metabacillus sp. RGM 3146 TaxID=3401092 RepID=UPI003B9B0258
MKRKLFGVCSLFILTALILSACSGNSPADKIYESLEKVVTLENPFKEQQKPLMDSEQKENQLYNKIVALGMKDYSQIVTLSKQALVLVDDREKRIEKEHDSMKNSHAEFKKAEAEMKNLDKADPKKKAEEIKQLMNERYNSYEKLYTSYKEAASLDKTLYTLFQKKDLKLAELEDYINKINQSYQKVIEENKQFNEYTKQYNEQKKEFYKAAGLKTDAK